MGKRLWILNHYAVTPDLPGGTRHFDFGTELVKRGHEVTIFASGFGHKTRTYVKVNRTERFRVEMYDGVRFIWINTFPYSGNDWRRVLNMLSYSWRVLGCTKDLAKPDAIIGSCVHPFAALSGWWLSRRYGAEFFFEERDRWPQTLVDMGALKKNSLLAEFLYRLEMFLYKKAKKVIVLMPNGVQYVMMHGCSSDKVVWLPNGVYLDRFDNPEPIDANSEVAICFERYKDKFKVVYLGAHGSANNLDVLVESAALIEGLYPEIHFFFIGDGPEKYKLRKIVQEKKLQNVSFLSPVPKSQVSSVLAKSDLLVHTIKRIGGLRYGISPNKMFDYMASGKPVVTAIETTNNPVEEAGCGLNVEPEDPKALAEAIIEIYEMPEEGRKQLGLNGRRYVEKYHDIKKLTDQLEMILGWKSDSRLPMASQDEEVPTK